MSREVLDLLGEVCPVPLARTREALRRLPVGAELVVETDFARAVRNITDLCYREGYTWEIDDRKRGIFRLTIRKP